GQHSPSSHLFPYTTLFRSDVVPPARQRGANYGWSVYEGDERFKQGLELTPGGPLIVPALTYLHNEGACSIVAGFVYHGHAIPELDRKSTRLNSSHSQISYA